MAFGQMLIHGVAGILRVAGARGVWLCALCLAAPAPAEEGQQSVEAISDAGHDVADLDLESLLSQTVVSSTKQAQRGAQAPAVMSVVTREEIVARGYTSLAEIVRSVPGFYDVYDLHTHNVGVRGVNGGARASGSVLKLMIDGVPTDYRPSTGNFFGEELIPIEAIERVEIIRGPASALYGANAYLGVINVIPRSGGSTQGLRVLASAGAVRDRPAGGGGLLLGVKTEEMDVLFAAQAFAINRGGLALPGSSPALDSAAVAARGVSGPDIARPKTLFGKVEVQGLRGMVTGLVSLQNLDTNAEFLDVAPLTHGTRAALLNQNYRLRYGAAPTESLSFEISGGYFTGGPTAQDVVDLDRPDYLLLRREGVEGFSLAAELGVEPHEKVSLLFAADFVHENHLIQSFDQLWLVDLPSLKAGSIVPGVGSGNHRLFENLGGFVQVMFRPTSAWSVTGGARMDRHNIYGIKPTWRLGIVYAPEDRPVSAKLLYGTAFKAPTAQQLYALPMTLLDIQGNPELGPQNAQTLEASFGFRAGERVELSLNAFGMHVSDRVEFLQRGLFVAAQNVVSEWIAGGELDGRFRLSPGLRARLGASFARTVSASAGPLLTGAPEVQNSLYPALQVHGSTDYALPWWGLRFGVEASYIAPRTASQSNALRRGEAYAVPGYVYTAASLSMPERKLFGERETRMSLRIGNLINRAYSDPGFGGVDVPAQGITAMLTWVQQL